MLPPSDQVEPLTPPPAPAVPLTAVREDTAAVAPAAPPKAAPGLRVPPPPPALPARATPGPGDAPQPPPPPTPEETQLLPPLSSSSPTEGRPPPPPPPPPRGAVLLQGAGTPELVPPFLPPTRQPIQTASSSLALVEDTVPPPPASHCPAKPEQAETQRPLLPPSPHLPQAPGTSPTTFMVGDRVSAFFFGQWYNAKIVQIWDKSTPEPVEVAWEEEDTHSLVSFADLRLLERPPRAAFKAKAKPPPPAGPPQREAPTEAAQAPPSPPPAPAAAALPSTPVFVPPPPATTPPPLRSSSNQVQPPRTPPAVPPALPPPSAPPVPEASPAPATSSSKKASPAKSLLPEWPAVAAPSAVRPRAAAAAPVPRPSPTASAASSATAAAAAAPVTEAPKGKDAPRVYAGVVEGFSPATGYGHIRVKKLGRVWFAKQCIKERELQLSANESFNGKRVTFWLDEEEDDGKHRAAYDSMEIAAEQEESEEEAPVPTPQPRLAPGSVLQMATVGPTGPSRAQKKKEAKKRLNECLSDGSFLFASTTSPASSTAGSSSAAAPAAAAASEDHDSLPNGPREGKDSSSESEPGEAPRRRRAPAPVRKMVTPKKAPRKKPPELEEIQEEPVRKVELQPEEPPEGGRCCDICGARAHSDYTELEEEDLVVKWHGLFADKKEPTTTPELAVPLLCSKHLNELKNCKSKFQKLAFKSKERNVNELHATSSTANKLLFESLFATDPERLYWLVRYMICGCTATPLFAEITGTCYGSPLERAILDFRQEERFQKENSTRKGSLTEEQMTGWQNLCGILAWFYYHGWGVCRAGQKKDAYLFGTAVVKQLPKLKDFCNNKCGGLCQGTLPEPPTPQEKVVVLPKSPSAAGKPTGEASTADAAAGDSAVASSSSPVSTEMPLPVEMLTFMSEQDFYHGGLAMEVTNLFGNREKPQWYLKLRYIDEMGLDKFMTTVGAKLRKGEIHHFEPTVHFSHADYCKLLRQVIKIVKVRGGQTKHLIEGIKEKLASMGHDMEDGEEEEEATVPAEG